MMNKRQFIGYYYPGDIVKDCKLIERIDSDHWRVQCVAGHEIIKRRCSFTSDHPLCTICSKNKLYMGRRRGKFIVIKVNITPKGVNRLICQCDCGNIKEFPTNKYIPKLTKSGCDDCRKILQTVRNKNNSPFVRDREGAFARLKKAAIEKYINKKIGIFTVLEFVDFVSRPGSDKRNAAFICQCDCGNIVQLRASKIVSRNRCSHECKLTRKYIKRDAQIDVFDAVKIEVKPPIIDIPDDIKESIILLWKSKLYSIDALAIIFKQNNDIIKQIVENAKKT